jgi:ATP-dependent Clp endopeptidase proteolytic subunit ClpP
VAHPAGGHAVLVLRGIAEVDAKVDQMTVVLEKAELDKLRAETAEIRARMARAKVLAVQMDARADIRTRLREVELETAELELREERCTARNIEIGAAKTERDERLLLTQWQFQRVYNFTDSVTKSSVTTCIDRLNQWTVMDPGCAIQITFNSPGGSVIDGMWLFDYIRLLRGKGHVVTCIALGYAASMAGILLQAASDGCRVMSQGSWLLIHEVAFSAGGKIGEVEDEYKFGLRLKEQAAKIFVERSNGKLTREALEAMWNRKDCWLDPGEALALGIIDEVR